MYLWTKTSKECGIVPHKIGGEDYGETKKER
jgi:hypothetical protein